LEKEKNMAKLVYKRKVGRFFNKRTEVVELLFSEGIVVSAEGFSFQSSMHYSSSIDSQVSLKLDTSDKEFVVYTPFRINVGEKVRLYWHSLKGDYGNPSSIDGFEIFGPNNQVIFRTVTCNLHSGLFNTEPYFVE
jgi:hypothetical protein